MTRAEKTALPRMGDFAFGDEPTANCFQFHTQNKIKSNTTSGMVKLIPPATQNMLELRIPLDAAVNKDEVAASKTAIQAQAEQAERARSSEFEGESKSKHPRLAAEPELAEVKPIVPLEACLASYFCDENMDFRDEIGSISNSRLRTLPKYLMLKLGRYAVGENWVQVKIDAVVPVPETLDLNAYRREGVLDGETEMPEPTEEENANANINAEQGAADAGVIVLEPNIEIVSTLIAMGFSENGSKRAALATNNTNSGKSKSNLKTLNISISLYCWHLMSGGVLH